MSISVTAYSTFKIILSLKIRRSIINLVGSFLIDRRFSTPSDILQAGALYGT